MVIRWLMLSSNNMVSSKCWSSGKCNWWIIKNLPNVCVCGSWDDSKKLRWGKTSFLFKKLRWGVLSLRENHQGWEFPSFLAKKNTQGFNTWPSHPSPNSDKQTPPWVHQTGEAFGSNPQNWKGSFLKWCVYKTLGKKYSYQVILVTVTFLSPKRWRSL